MLITLLMVGVIGMSFLYFQLGKLRDSRYQTYFALGQDLAALARVAHTYVQDNAYYNPYITIPGDAGQLQRLAHFEDSNGHIRLASVEAFRSPLIDVAGAVNPTQASGQFLLSDMRATIPGTTEGFLDPGFDLTRPIRGVRYEFRGHGGLMPLRTVKELQGASALIVLYGRAASTGSDFRTAADLAALRAGANSSGLSRIGIVLPPSQRAGLTCHGQAVLARWGDTDADCLSAGDAASLGMNLQPFDIVAPAWEATEKSMHTDVIFRRPQPGLQDMNVMYTDMHMDGASGYGTIHRIADAVEISTNTVNVDSTPPTPSTLDVGDTAVGAPDGNALLVVGRANNSYFAGTPVCARVEAGACIDGEINIDKDMAVFYREEKNPDFVKRPAPPELVKVDGGVEIAKGNLTINIDQSKPEFADKGYFDTKGGTGKSTFNVNGQNNGGNGTVINKTVKVNELTVDDQTGTENFVVEDELAINGQAVQIGTAAKPSQVIFTTAPVTGANGNLAIDTSGKGNGNGVYSSYTDAGNLAQSGASPTIFKSVIFPTDASMTVNGNIAVQTTCVGDACPDRIVTPPLTPPVQ